MMSYPSLAKHSARSTPMPTDAPVTSAVCPSPFRWCVMTCSLGGPCVRLAATGARASSSGDAPTTGGHAIEELFEQYHTRFGFLTVRFLVGIVPAVVVATGNRLHDDAIAPRHHIQVLVHQAVVDVFLRNQPGDLPSHRYDALIRPELSAAIPRAIADHPLRHRRKILR